MSTSRDQALNTHQNFCTEEMEKPKDDEDILHKNVILFDSKSFTKS